ncbi:DUF2065 domain-containing protein [Roseomonas sp. ROY-5-3]|uniref:DUF2065 domain-containing protein n=2 Tax=Acetobacterales TaxID=3120395 RepID=A0ABS6HCT7_9PROT|nr:DUF2065 domain-containing protein [Roseomonas oleicola]
MLAVEGLCYGLFPAAMKRMIASLLTVPDNRLRQFGLVAATIGVTAAWIIVLI